MLEKKARQREERTEIQRKLQSWAGDKDIDVDGSWTHILLPIHSANIC